MEGGERRTKGFKTLKAAEAFKAEREAENQQFGTDASLTATEHSAVLESRMELAELGMTLREAISQAIDYRRKALKSATASVLSPAIPQQSIGKNFSKSMMGEVNFSTAVDYGGLVPREGFAISLGWPQLARPA